MVARREGEMLYPEQIRAKTQWKKDGVRPRYVCAHCSEISETHPRSIPFTACPNTDCPSKWENLRIPRQLPAS
jgi:hypothetical protein